MQCCSTDLSRIALKFTDKVLFLTILSVIAIFRAGRLRTEDSFSMTAMLIGCVFSILEKNGKIVLALSLVGMNAVWESGVFEIEEHNAFTSFLIGIESMIKGMNPVYPAIIYAIVSISLFLLVMKRFKLRFE